jgi:hypothetical protein
VTARRALVSGVAVAVVYLVALEATVAVRGGHTRPLYDGVAPPPKYSWVVPPAFFASGNVEPAAISENIALGPSGSAAAGIATPDGQFVIDLGPAAIARHGADRDVRVRIVPVAPKHLGAVPDGLRSNGNAYRVEMTYEPSQTAVSALEKPGTMLIEIPELGSHLFSSGDGRIWSTLVSRTEPPRELSLSAAFIRPAYYLAATNLPELQGPSGSESHRSVEVGVGTAVLAAVLILVVYVVRRRHVHRERSM